MNKALSIFFWFKQTGDRQEFKYKWFDDVSGPSSYILANPKTDEVSKTEVFENWPLEIKAFETTFATVPKNPFFLQPKRTDHSETNIDYFVSPRIYMRYFDNVVSGAMYTDCFKAENLLIMRE